ncbi:MAG: VTT domain-containing protein [Anaerolineae bacterium]|nr:VTT domain-containing protein [Anaerolineae bacterium]MDW8072432.1 VTT domain-containing protein [Anaerolineae bacterium]
MQEPQAPAIVKIPPLCPSFEKLGSWWHSPRAQLLGRIAAVMFSVAVTAGIILLRQHIRTFAVYGYPGIFLVSLIGNATLLLPAPTYAIVFAVGGVMNPILVGIVAGLGASLGEMTGYLAGVGGRSMVENRAIYTQLEYWMRRAGWLVILALGTIPNPFFDVGGMVAGALRMPLYRFLLAAWAGKTIRFILLGFTGEFFLGS